MRGCSFAKKLGLFMKKLDQLSRWAIELQSIAQDGIEYGHDRFDRERYQQIREIATKMMAAKTGEPIDVIKGLFSSDDGYQTPKVSTRAAIFTKQKILLVKESTDNLWSMPGGWCEPNMTVKENCIKEAEEESGHKIAVEQIIAVNNHSTNIYDNKRVERAINVCNVIFLCRDLGGKFVNNTETEKCSFFDFDNLPPLSVPRNSLAEIKMCFEANQSSNWQTRFE